MPTYVYACDQCGAEFEQFQRFSDAPLTTCPRCEGKVRRVFQPVGVMFKGSGWYVTDSRKGSSATVPATADSTPEAAPGAKPEPAPAADTSSTAGGDAGGTASTSESSTADAKAA
jgi:putative FmdB family regulatory protein